MFASTATLVALSAGVDELRVGAVVSTVVKLNAVVLEIPAYELLELSSKAVASIKTQNSVDPAKFDDGLTVI